ncbi:MAG TPA: hypothetical protein VFN28_01445 [Amaricoccus sp.]|jgi:hypothetical protein|nr:hypothetical protein [Amaricoccus sp.]
MSLRLALLVLLIIAAWKVIAWRRRIAARPPAPSVEPARACPDCGAYVLARHPKPCDRPDCHYRA